MDKMVLADGIVDSYDSKTTGRNGNILVLGSSGSGKTTSISLAQALKAEKDSYVISIAKSAQLSQFKRIFKKKGYEIHTLNLVNPENGDAFFDPMAYVKYTQDVESLASKIIKTSEASNWSRDPYWDDAARSMIQAEIYAVTEMLNGRKPATILDVLEFHEDVEFKSDTSGFTTSSVDIIFEDLKRKNPRSNAYRYWKVVKGLASKTVSCVLSTVNTAYTQMFTPTTLKVPKNGKSVDIRSIGKKRQVFFVVTNPTNRATQAFADLFYAQVFKTLFEEAQKSKSYELSVPVHLICDDFACGCKIPDFDLYISIMRSCGMSATVILQSLTQLKSLYGADGAATIEDNCDQLVFFGNNDIENCAKIARRADVDLQEVMSMPIGSAFVFQRGNQPKRTSRYQVYEDEEYKKFAESGEEREE